LCRLTGWLRAPTVLAAGAKFCDFFDSRLVRAVPLVAVVRKRGSLGAIEIVCAAAIAHDVNPVHQAAASG
jgi:hypothetical protein